MVILLIWTWSLGLLVKSLAAGTGVDDQFLFDRLPIIAHPPVTVEIIFPDKMALLRRVEKRVAAPAFAPNRCRLVVLARATFADCHLARYPTRCWRVCASLSFAVPCWTSAVLPLLYKHHTLPVTAFDREPSPVFAIHLQWIVRTIVMLKLSLGADQTKNCSPAPRCHSVDEALTTTPRRLIHWLRPAHSSSC